MLVKYLFVSRVRIDCPSGLSELIVQSLRLPYSKKSKTLFLSKTSTSETTSTTLLFMALFSFSSFFLFFHLVNVELHDSDFQSPVLMLKSAACRHHRQTISFIHVIVLSSFQRIVRIYHYLIMPVVDFYAYNNTNLHASDSQSHSSPLDCKLRIFFSPRLLYLFYEENHLMDRYTVEVIKYFPPYAETPQQMMFVPCKADEEQPSSFASE